MSRHSRAGGDSPVSLFPFLSILACMIGTLTLMITALALTGMGTGRDDASIQRAEDYVALRKQTDADQKRSEELHQALLQAESLKDRVAALQALLQSQDVAAGIAARAAQLSTQAGSAHSQTAALESELARLRKELETLRLALAARQQRSLQELVRVLPPKGASAIRFKPYFVEAGKSDLTVYDGAQPYKVKNSAIKTDPKFDELLNRLAGSDTAQLVVLVRSDGVAAMNAVMAWAESKGISCGKLPLVGTGAVDLSSF